MNQWKIIKLECNQIVFDGVCLKCRLLGSVPDLLSKKNAASSASKKMDCTRISLFLPLSTTKTLDIMCGTNARRRKALATKNHRSPAS